MLQTALPDAEGLGSGVPVVSDVVVSEVVVSVGVSEVLMVVYVE